MSRTPIIAGNWKMHKTIEESVRFIHALIPKVAHARCQILLAPPFTALSNAAAAAKGSNVVIGAQNMSDTEEGAFTGEISLPMLKEAGAQFVLLGHSERRIHFGETEGHIHHKVKRALLGNFPFILCIGESEEEREKGLSAQVLRNQLKSAFQNMESAQLKNLMIAYEPIWAIGTGKVATPELAEETHKTIRHYFEEEFETSFAESLPILYGGSVNPSNIKNILQRPGIDGALIGGASLDVESFTQMVLQ